MTEINKRKVGAFYESLTADWLESRGWTVLERSYRCRVGEIDLIARKGKNLSFIEVKYRTGAWYGGSPEAVDRRKQMKIIRVAQWYAACHPWTETMNCRYDVAAFREDGTLEYIEGAFGGM